MLHALLLIPFCPWVGLCSIDWFLVLVGTIDGLLAKTMDQILSLSMDTTKFWNLTPPQYNSPTTAGFS